MLLADALQHAAHAAEALQQLRLDLQLAKRARAPRKPAFEDVAPHRLAELDGDAGLHLSKRRHCSF